MMDTTEETLPDTTAAPTEAASETETPTEAPTVPAEPPEEAILTVQEQIEVHSALTIAELFSETNVILEHDNDPVPTDTLGECEITISYLYDGVRYAHPVSYFVSDTTAPVLLNSGWGAEVVAGEAFDLEELVGYADNHDPAPVLTWTGSVDTGVIGSYPISATVTDSAGNATSWELTVEVVAEEITPEDNAPRLQFADFAASYGGEGKRLGIDVSKWQGDIDFEAVKAAGCSFVIMRMGYYYDDHEMDVYYEENMRKAQEAGLDVGVYLYTTANTEEEVRANAQWMLEILDGQELDFPVVFDWESFSNFQQYDMSIHDLNTLFTIFAEELESGGYSAMLYSSKNFLNNFWYEHGDFPIWLAHYTDATDYEGEYCLWQMSCRGRIPGITGDVDLNVLFTEKWEEFFPE